MKTLGKREKAACMIANHIGPHPMQPVVAPTKFPFQKGAAFTFAALRLLYDSFSFVTGKKSGTGNRRQCVH